MTVSPFRGFTGFAIALSFVAALVLPHVAEPAPQGFGAGTRGGEGYPVVYVTTLADSGSGSLREALSAGHRTIVFDVAGDIVLAAPLYVRGPFVTIDGLSAPAPGVTLRGYGLGIHGNAPTVFSCGSTCYGAHDVVVRGLRIRAATDDGLRVAHGAYNVLIEHVSIQGSTDGNLDITDSHDVTVAWSILAEPALDQKNMLIKYKPNRVTLHHNLFVAATQRNPQVRIDDAGTAATDTTVDMRNNVVWDWGPGYGTLVWYGPRVNVVANFFSAPASALNDQNQALTVCDGVRMIAACGQGTSASRAWAYVEGNVSADPITVDLDAEGTVASPFPAPPVDTRTACAAAHDVVAGAGVRPLDAVDAGYLARVKLPACATPSPLPSPPPPSAGGTIDVVVTTLTAPASAPGGTTIAVADTVKNQGTGVSAPSTVTFSLSANTTYEASDVLLGSRIVPELAAGASSSATTSVTLPAGLSPASYYYVIARADADGALAESVETNNTRSRAIRIVAPDLIVYSLLAASTATRGSTLAVTDTVRNQGTVPAGASTIRFYLSVNGAWDTNDIEIGHRSVPALSAGATSKATTTVTIPAAIAARTYYVIGRADADRAIAETIETNNSRYRSLGVR